jgi:hypothetical protein
VRTTGAASWERVPPHNALPPEKEDLMQALLDGLGKAGARPGTLKGYKLVASPTRI